MADDTGADDDMNMVLVVHFSRKSWVIKNANWILDWETQGRAHVAVADNRYLYDRTKALTLAHNIQNRTKSKYGVCVQVSQAPCIYIALTVGSLTI